LRELLLIQCQTSRESIATNRAPPRGQPEFSTNAISLICVDIQVTKLDTLRLARIWAERDKEPEMLSRVGSFYNFGYSHVEKRML